MTFYTLRTLYSLPNAYIPLDKKDYPCDTTVSDYINLWLILILVYCSAGLALAASKAQDIPPLPLPDTSQTQASQDSSTIETAKPILELADVVLPAAIPKPTMPDNTQTVLVSKSTKGSGKAKMRPDPTKNGRYI